MIKPWWQSKTVWLGGIVTALGVIPVVIEFLKTGSFDAVSVLTLITGILVVIRRLWFTDNAILV